MSAKPLLEVVCAIIEENGKILAVRRKEGENMAGKWEFPGGKIKNDELPENSIIREIQEELAIRIIPQVQLLPVNHEYAEFKIHLIPYRCKLLSGNISLRVHDRFRWLLPGDYYTLNWCDADRIIVKQLSDNLF